jgi:hypothetical protein
VKFGPRARCWLVALACAGSLALWQGLTVRFTYSGNWTGLFGIGELFETQPPELERPYLFAQSYGYDGQQYRIIAHDPFLQRGFARYLDDPRLRYRRILVPLLAYVAAFGSDSRVDAAYIAVEWMFFLLGAYWFARFAQRLGYRPWTGLLFALVPATLISADRLTVDAVLAACCVGFALYSREEAHARLYAVLVLGGLVRETGLLLLIAYCAWLLLERRIRTALIYSTAALPALAWYGFVAMRTDATGESRLTPLIFSGLADRFIHPAAYPPGLGSLAIPLDYLALAATAAAIVWPLYRGCRSLRGPTLPAACLFAVLGAALPPGDLWSEVYAFGRSLTPLFLLSALDGLAAGSFLPLMTMLALDPRIGLQMAPQFSNMIRGLLAWEV